MRRILNIGVDASQISQHEVKIRKLFNGLNFFGFFTAIIQVAIVVQQDLQATIFHSVWGVYCIIAFLLHYRGYFKFAKVSVVIVILVFGSLAAARIGSDYYPHIGSFGIMGAAFVFFDLRKEWGYLLLIVLLHASAMFFVESDMLRNPEVQYDNPTFIRSSTIIGTSLFVALEIVTILRISWLAEKEIISDLKKSNEELKQISEEKTVMLQEIHHRVKNNFQMIVSLIRLQTNNIDDQKTIDTFDELRMRLISIARMHEMMYISDKINKINIKKYVEELCNMIKESTGTDDQVGLDVKTKVEHLSAQGIVPLALILNELITNSVKHAFQSNNDLKPKIDISLDCLENGKYKLIYADNGSWKDQPDDSNGFGLELINLLTDQLDGEYERTSLNQGTKYIFELRI